MNFCTLTSKRRVVTSLFSILFLLVLFNFSLHYYVKVKTTKDYYVTDKFSKIKHYQLNQNNDDIVFIGSSRTLFGISTKVFEDFGLQVYNLGMQAMQFEEYPSTLGVIINNKPKLVVVSLTIDKLYEDLKIPKFPSSEELDILEKVDTVKYLQSIYRYLLNFNYFYTYSEAIYNKIKVSYKKFNYTSRSKSEYLSNNNSSDHLVDGCNIINKQISGNRVNIKCDNGDGILFDNSISLDSYEHKVIKNLDQLNIDSVDYLNYFLNKILKKGINVTLVLEPISNIEYKYDLSQVEKSFNNVNIIDLSSFYIERTMWADDGHLNNQGREFYSKELYNSINFNKNITK